MTEFIFIFIFSIKKYLLHLHRQPQHNNVLLLACIFLHTASYNQEWFILQTIYVINKKIIWWNLRWIIRSSYKSRLGYNSACTGTSFSGALIPASVNPEYNKRLFIDFPDYIQVQNMFCTKIVFFWHSKYSLIQKTCDTFTIVQSSKCVAVFLNQTVIFVHSMFLTCIFWGIQWTISGHIAG